MRPCVAEPGRQHAAVLRHGAGAGGAVGGVPAGLPALRRERPGAGLAPVLPRDGPDAGHAARAHAGRRARRRDRPTGPTRQRPQTRYRRRTEPHI